MPRWAAEEAVKKFGSVIPTLRAHQADELIQAWMDWLSHHTRKRLSYDGALRSQPGDPVHYRCPRTQYTYFDPVNAVYGLVVDVFCPTRSSGWNVDTKGDIIEGILGFYYQARSVGGAWVHRVRGRGGPKICAHDPFGPRQ